MCRAPWHSSYCVVTLLLPLRTPALPAWRYKYSHLYWTLTHCQAVVGTADVLVTAVGVAGLIKGSWLKPGAVVIDCGTNPIPDDTKKSGQRLVGDVDFDSAKAVASAITPVPGGWWLSSAVFLIITQVSAL